MPIEQKCHSRAKLLAILLTLLSTTASHAAPLVRCQITYAGATHTLDTAPGTDPYGVESMDIGGHPHLTQDTEQYKGKPIIYSVGNFVIDALDNDTQKIGWVLRLQLDKAGVQSWATSVAHIDNEGIPHLAIEEKSPSWQRGVP